MYKRVENIKKEKLFYVWDFAALLVVVAIVVAAIVMLTKPTGKTVEIYVDGTLKYTYSLAEDRVVEIEGLGKNVVEIKDGKVKMIDADCPNDTCTETAAISAVGEQIVCLPNKVIVVITGDGDGGELDAKT